jgi:hypothetical protein
MRRSREKYPCRELNPDRPARKLIQLVSRTETQNKPESFLAHRLHNPHLECEAEYNYGCDQVPLVRSSHRCYMRSLREVYEMSA